MSNIKRPQVTKEMISEAAKALCKRNHWDDDQAADIASVYEHHMDGYELAKALEDDCCWAIRVTDVDTLDCMSSKVDDLHRAACRKWADENNIQPPLPVGTMLTIGEITGIYEHAAASYLVNVHGNTDPNRRRIVRFEDAVAAPAGSVPHGEVG